jgi:hypothetical protein
MLLALHSRLATGGEADRHVQPLGGEQAVHLGDVQAGRVDGGEYVQDDVRLLQRGMIRS